MTAYCVEEAAMLAYDLHLAAEQEREEEAAREQAAADEALKRAKELHFQATGVRT